MSTPTNPNQLLEDARLRIEAEANKTSSDTRRFLSVLLVLLPAAYHAAAGGNVTMKQALLKVQPLLK